MPRMAIVHYTPATAVGSTPAGPAGTSLAPQGIATIVDSAAQIILAPCHGRTQFLPDAGPSCRQGAS